MLMMSRRNVIAAALAVPTVSGAASWFHTRRSTSVLMHDASLEAGRRFATAATTVASIPINGDRVRLARKMLAGRPAIIAGVTRNADMVLIADVAREAGYYVVTTLHAWPGHCRIALCRSGWSAVASLIQSAKSDWPEALAYFGADQGGGSPWGLKTKWAAVDIKELALGGILAPRESTLV